MPLTPFDPPPLLTDAEYSVRPITAADRPSLTLAASDPLIWEGHPAKNRFKPEVFAPYFDFLMDAGGVVTLHHGAEVIGCSRFYPVPDQPSGIGIGFTFITRPHWGGRANHAIKALMLDHAFAHVPEVWFHIAPSNLRSQKATGKLGVKFEYQAEIDLGTGATSWMCYRLDAASWSKAATRAG